MAVTFIKDAITERLERISYKRIVYDTKPSVKNTFKEVLLTGDNIDVSLFSDREFEVKLPEKEYNQILATDFWFSLQKVTEHSRLFSVNLTKKVPPTWLLVSAYYSAFYSAIELSRLFGVYNLYLKKEHTEKILSYIPGGDKLDRGNYIGVVHEEINDYVTIRFSAKENTPPHDLAWKNILKMLNSHNISDIRPSKIEVFRLMKSILNSSATLIQTPNNVRNDWNYSFPNAYDENFYNEISEIKTYLDPGGRQSIMSWPSKHKRLTSKQNNVFSVIYLELILRQVMADMKVKLYEEVG